MTVDESGVFFRTPLRFLAYRPGADHPEEMALDPSVAASVGFVPLPPRATVPDPRALRAYHAWHHNHTCAGLPLLRLEDDSEQKWATFCEAVPRKWRARCRKSASASPWPLINAIGGVQAYRLTFASTAVKNETRSP